MTDNGIKNKILIEKQIAQTAFQQNYIKLFMECLDRVNRLDKSLYGTTKDEAQAIEGD
jgi:hypothetical protein